MGSVETEPFDAAAEIHSESVLLSVVTEDASAALFARLCRYPSAQTAWAWVHVLTAAGCWSYTDDRVGCAPEPLDLTDDVVRYEASAPVRGSWKRNGPRDAPDSAELAISVPAHPVTSGPAGPGTVALNVEARFSPRHGGGGTLPGRSEVLGDAVVEVSAGDTVLNFGGVAQWHEQEQSAPRFRVPFTYASLQGDGIALIALIGPKASGGFLRGDLGDLRLTEASIGPEDLMLRTEQGTALRGTSEVVHAYSLPIYGRTWRGTFVRATLEGRSIVGFVNRWDPEAPAFEGTVSS